MKAVILCATILSLTVFSYGQNMNVHTKANGTQSYSVADIDSITFSYTIPTESLVAYYPFNGNANDLSGKGHNGTANGCSLVTDRLGNGNSAYYFDGINDRMYFGSWFTYQTFTISLWVNADSLNTGWASLIDNNHTGSQNWTIHQTDDTLNEYSWATGEPYSPTPIFFHLIPNKWQHLVAIKDALNTNIKVYINGRLIGEEYSADVNYSEQNLVCGAWYAGPSRFWKGYLDDIRMYNCVLDSMEIKALYHENGWSGN